MTAPGVPDPGTRPKVDVGTGAGNAILNGLNAIGGPEKVNQTVKTVTAPLSGLEDATTAVRAWVSDRHNWVRVMWFGGGVICFAIGAAMLAGRPVSAAVTTVLPAGKAMKAVKSVGAKP